MADHRARSLDVTLPCEAGACAVATITVSRDTDHLASFLAGVVAAEGSFSRVRVSTGGHKERFAFQVGLAATDRGTCEALREFFGVGSLVFASRRKPHYDDEVTFRVGSIRDLVEVVVPFMDQHLPRSHKRSQYGTWRAALLDYWENTGSYGR